MDLPWQHRLKREDARTAQERFDRFRRRARILERAVLEEGDQPAVAEKLGKTKQAVSKEIHAADGAPPDRLIDMLSLDLPHLAARTVTVGEWEQQSLEEQPVTAQAAARAWRARAAAALSAAEMLRGSAASPAAGSSTAVEEYQRLLDALGLARSPDSDAPQPQLAVLAEFADGLEADAREAARQVTRWEQRAEGHVPTEGREGQGA